MSEHQSKPAPGPAPAVPLREQQGAITKRVILGSARARFGASGYRDTSVREIARDAGVAVQTVYNTFGSKAGIVLGLGDLVDEEAGVHPLFLALATSDDPRDGLRHFARIRRQIRERCGDIVRVLRSSAVVDEAVASAWAEGLRRRHAGVARVADRLAEAGLLKPGLDAARAADIIAAIVADEVCDVLVDQRGWSYDDYEAWLAGVMADEVLDAGGEDIAEGAT